MQPGVTGRLDAVGQQWIMCVITATTTETVPGRRAFRVAVQPFDDATSKRLGLGLGTWLSAIELNDACTLVKEDLPILSRPAVRTTKAFALSDDCGPFGDVGRTRDRWGLYAPAGDTRLGDG